MNIKKYFLLLTVLCIGTVVYSQVYVGGGLNFVSNKSFKAIGPSLKIGVVASEKIDINGNYTYYLKDYRLFSYSFDAHYKLFNVQDKLLVHPFAGLIFTKQTVTNNSANFGVTFKLPTEKYQYYFEPRWILDNNQFVFTVGINLLQI